MKTKAINMCLGCGKTVDTSSLCKFNDRYGIYHHVECSRQVKRKIQTGSLMLDNREKEWKNRKAKSRRLEY